MPAQLIALTDGPNILLDKPIFLVGRDQECDIRYDSRKISRRHCCIAQVNDYVVVRDLGSTNGVRINGVRVLEGRLRPGDELAIAHYRYQVRWDEQAMRGRRIVSALPQPEGERLEKPDQPAPGSNSDKAGEPPDASADTDPTSILGSNAPSSADRRSSRPSARRSSRRRRPPVG